ncbi:putative tetratricopeptide-like helical domain superfamily [Helianthus annuus]|nr:putative tetratricopeptide-like helical domain superfamily [Helianthus annuus]KAJ0533546.1 putative tetratricopeptide-like helical domain superfamily [Helianthus annuus]KAJ0541817.1 putative tetratricopeptide-like helical domain superfamily [Helianthus annuus]KAJ0706893.1 putative tetratricopeptide-like helical domain superfamily [Helianthus annuus]KAJ0710912.1 putative tetratricopeptide-like helical domain superfamily [Helianthus annuus]
MRTLNCPPDGYTFPFLLKACGHLPSFRRGASLHGNVFVFGLQSNVFVANASVPMYAHCGHLDYARLVFDQMLSSSIADVIS